MIICSQIEGFAREKLGEETRLYFNVSFIEILLWLLKRHVEFEDNSTLY